jgi:hypothetical protein
VVCGRKNRLGAVGPVLASLAFCGLLAGCSNPQLLNVQLMDITGSLVPVSNESAAARMSEGFLTISNENLTCGGRYLNDAQVYANPTPVECTDGRSGSATTKRVTSGVEGRLLLQDGTEVVFALADHDLPADTRALRPLIARRGFGG